MSSFILWLAFQVGTTAMCVGWYARKHPSDAKAMFLKWRGIFSRICRVIRSRGRLKPESVVDDADGAKLFGE